MAAIKLFALIVSLTLINVTIGAEELNFSEDEPCFECSQLVNNIGK